MARKEKQRKSESIYLKSKRKRVEIPYDLYEEIDRMNNTYRKRMQRRGQCKCPKGDIWACDTDCGTCKFQRSGDVVSLDYEYHTQDGEDYTLHDCIADLSPDIQSILEDFELLEALQEHLMSLEPMQRIICLMIAQGKSEREIQKHFGLKSRTTITRLKNKAFFELRNSLSEFI